MLGAGRGTGFEPAFHDHQSFGLPLTDPRHFLVRRGYSDRKALFPRRFFLPSRLA